LRHAILITVALTLISATASAGPTHTSDVTNYNYLAARDGERARLDGTRNIEVFSVDFAKNDYTANRTYLADFTRPAIGRDLRHARLGRLTHWTPAFRRGDAADDKTINGGNAMARYQMAAYLVSTYDGQGGSSRNSHVQDAIWHVLDPGSGTPDSFLSNYHVVSDAGILTCIQGPAKCGAFVEEFAAVPEPLHPSLVLMGLLLAGATIFRKAQTVHRAAR